ncbi:MAG TPA: PRC-barrel domain-containing protein [Myxococcaceae bacterium]|nr:PRC-barrel domain-containing protein [Myxococcaceae bacterium]
MPVVLLLSAFTGVAAAQESTPQSQQSAPAPANPGPLVGGVVLGVTVTESEALAFGYRISKLLHSQVWNDKGEKIGKTEDFIVKPDGRVTFAIIDVGGFLGIGAHRVAIPVSQIAAVKPHVVVPGATKDALKALPEFKYAKDSNRS